MRLSASTIPVLILLNPVTLELSYKLGNFDDTCGHLEGTVGLIVTCKNNLSIKCFWGKGGKMEGTKGESWFRRETPDPDAFAGAFHSHTAWYDTIQSKSHAVIGLSASRVKKLAWNKSHFTVWPSSGACVVTISLFSETSKEEF